MASQEFRYDNAQKGTPEVTTNESSPFVSLSPSDRSPPASRRAAIMGWAGEILAVTMSVVTFLSIAAIAWSMDDRPLDDWRGGISINAAISALTVVSRATLAIPIVACISQLKWLHFRSPHKISEMDVFDSASRGGFGSAMLLLKVPKSGASLGAIITLLAYFIGPFYQQVIHLEQRTIDVPGKQSANAFAYSHEYSTNVTGSGHLDLRTIDSQMQGAMVAGLFGFEVHSNFNCSSICDWSGPFTTLGFHQECRNITTETLATKRCLSIDGGKEVDDTFYNTHNCTLMTPSNIPLYSHISPTSQYTENFLTGHQLSVGVSPNIFTAVRYTILRDESGMTADIYGENVEECTISVAAHTYTGIRASGNRLTFEHKDVISSKLSVRDDGEVNARLTYSASGIPDLVVQRYDLKVILGFFSSEFTNKTVMMGPGAPEEFGFSGNLPKLDLKDAISNMTDRMTQRIANGPNRQIAVGTTAEQVIFVAAWYPMLVLPIFVTVATVLLLLFTMWESRSSTGTVLWKSSALALLYHSLPQSNDPRLAGGTLRCDFRDLKDLQKTANKITVQIID